MKKATSEFSFWYPANRLPDDPVLPGMEKYPVKRRRRVVVPMDSEGHITHNNKLICEKSKRQAQIDHNCTTGKTTKMPLAAIEVCGECKRIYARMGTSEIKRLEAWNNGEAKVF